MAETRNFDTFKSHIDFTVDGKLLETSWWNRIQGTNILIDLIVAAGMFFIFHHLGLIEVDQAGMWLMGFSFGWINRFQCPNKDEKLGKEIREKAEVTYDIAKEFS